MAPRLPMSAASKEGTIDEGRNAPQMRKSEIRYRRLFEAARDGILILNPETKKITDANPFMTELLEYKHDELLGKELWEIGLLKDEAASQSAFRELQSKFYVRYEDLPLQSKSGQSHAVEFVSNIYEEDGQNVIQCNIRDITERKAAQEKSTRAQRELVQTQVAILDALPAHIALVDSDGNIISVNGAWRRFAAANSLQGSDSSVGANYLKVCEEARGRNTEESIQVAQGLRNVLQGKAKEFALEYPCHSPKELRWFRLIITPLHENASGGAVITHINITERKLAEDKLRASETRYRSLASATAQIVWTANAKGKVVGLLPEWQEYTGQNIKEIKEDGWSKALHPDDRDQVFEVWTEAVRSQSPYDTEYRLRRHDGVYRDFAVHGIPVRNLEGIVQEWVGCCMDITERKRANEELARNQSLLRMASRVSRMGGWRVDIPSRLVVWSDETAAVHEQPPGFSPLITDALNYYTEEYREIVRKAFENCSKEGTPFDLDAQIVTAKGKCIWVRAIGEATRDPEGKIVQVQGAFQDIDSMMQAEESNALFRALIDQSDDAIEVIDPENGRFIDVNRRAWERLGYTREEMLNLHLSDIAVERDGLPVHEAMQEIRRSGSRMIDTEHRRKDGSIFPVEVNVQIIHLNRDYIIAVARDITERKRAEQQISEQAAFLDKTQDAIIARDLEGKILFWSKGAEHMYGWLKQDVLGENIGGLLYADPRKFEENNALTILHGEWSGELQHFTKSREEITIEARWTLVRDQDGHPKSVLAINTNITEKKKIQAQFMRAQRMESIGTLAGGIAHDLNNILAPILMSISLLKSDSDNPRTNKILETIEGSAQRGADIVRQVLSFARGLEGLKIEVQPRHLVKELENIIRNTFPKDIRLNLSISESTWPIAGDPTQLHQVLLNLSVNARDAMPRGGNLTLTVENCVLDEHYAVMHGGAKPGRYVKIMVSDSGTGIPPKLIDKIFEPFFTTKELSKGTGLGLSTVMAIVKSHEGIINVYSDQGKGTTFTLYFPAAELSAEASKEVLDLITIPRGKGETILVIDDEASILTITSQTLEAYGYRALTATDGADAVAIYLQNRNEISVVLTDMMMPVMDGASTIHALRRINPSVKIIAASGLNAEADIHKASQGGVKHFLVKPYTAGIMLKTIRQVIDEV
jgi:two-component system cell cycle sensor histidine kinase/response regulator CckA